MSYLLLFIGPNGQSLSASQLQLSAPEVKVKLSYMLETTVLLVLRAVIRAALAAFLSCPLIFSLRYYICCWVNKERKKDFN